MENPAPTDWPVHPLIRDRWSPRAFAPKALDRPSLHALFEAARWAPSSYNEQPWSYVVATKDDPEEFERLLACLVPGNRAWAHAAPVLMLSVAKLAFEKTGRPNRHAWHDVGLATENLVLQATSMGIVVHQMAGFDPDLARTTYEIPATHAPVAAIALGWPGDPASLSSDLRARETAPRSRRPQSEFVHRGRFGTGW